MAKFYTPTKLSENIHETPEGFLVCVGVPIARTGTQLYGEGETPLETGDDGKILIERDAEHVFNADTMSSFEGKPITIRHPDDFVSPENWKELSKGVIQNVRRGSEKDENGEELLLADLLIMDSIAIGLVKAGLREVSCGYDAEYEQISAGRGRQKNILGNHCALVEEGRAGPTCAIFDHKQEGTTMSKLGDNMKKFFSKAVDEAEAAEKGEKTEKKEEKSTDAGAYDELVQMVKDLGEKISGLSKAGKDEFPDKKEKSDAGKEDKEEKSKDEEEGEAGSSMEDRIKALETAVAKLLDGMSEKASDEDGEEMNDEDGEEAKSSMTGDTKARVEILAPGLKVLKGVDTKVKALEIAYASQEGRTVIHQLTGNKKPTFDSAEKVNHLFIATSEILKTLRGSGLQKTKDGKAFETGDNKNEAITPEKMNEINKARWASN